MKTILITGANKGLGFETARQLLKKGHHVIISGRNQERLKASYDTLAHDKAEMLLMDVCEQKSILAAAKQLMANHVIIDVLINNAAILHKDDHSLINDDFSIAAHTFNTNVFGVLHVIRAFMRLMKSPSRIINISSDGGSMSDPVGGWAPAYCISKTAVNALTRHLAVELQSRSISVNSVCPGWIQTDMGGTGAHRPVEKGAETPIWLATDAPQTLTGKFFRDKKELHW
ncbi:MAG: SDR family NAD(P)-dependent oxidoreductase [Cyclobacteriaceae bacterium]|nr:SDR family NAD(P)-dependent oxidoreductase [Cyclobacteriaceae bacterium]